MKTTEKERQEIIQGKLIANTAESIWNWSSNAGSRRAHRRAHLIVENAHLEANNLILEIGCGTGLFTELIFHKTKANILAIDISPDLIKVAQRRSINVKFDVQSAHNLHFKNETFDRVVGSSVLHHLEIDVALPEIFRVLKSKGKIVFVEPNLLNPQIFFQKKIPFIKKLLNDTVYETAFNRWNLKKNLERFGFKNCQIYPHEFLHPLTPQSLIFPVERIGKLIERTPLLKEFAGSLLIIATKN